jgi:hypothetical protein
VKRSFGRSVQFLVPAVVCLTLLAGSALAEDEPAAEPKFRAGHIEAPSIAECSGLVESRRHPGVFWCLNDSDNPPEIFALTREGKLLATFTVDARNVDWEDIAIDDDGHLYISETGNNNFKRRPAVVYQIDEPDPAPAPAAGEHVKPLPVKKTWRREFPAPADCESLFIYAGKGYLIDKRRDAKPATLYSFDLSGGPGPEKLEAVATLPIRMPVTGADITPDGKWLTILTVTGPYLFRVDGDVAAVGKLTPANVIFVSPKMESCAMVKEGVLAATEDRDVYLFRWSDFGLKDGDDKPEQAKQ